MASVPRKLSRFGSYDDYVARPRHFDPALADIIIDMLANGEVLTDICLDERMPLPATFLMWCREDEQLNERYRTAMELSADVTFDEALSAAYSHDTNQANIRYRAHMARAERLMPEKYGPRTTIRNTKEVDDAAAGIDYQSEVRRRLAAMAQRLETESYQTGESGTGGSPSE